MKHLPAILFAVLLATPALAESPPRGNGPRAVAIAEASVGGDRSASVSCAAGLAVPGVGGVCLPITPFYEKLLAEAAAISAAYGPKKGPIVALRHICMNDQNRRIERTLGGCPDMPK